MPKSDYSLEVWENNNPDTQEEYPFEVVVVDSVSIKSLMLCPSKRLANRMVEILKELDTSYETLLWLLEPQP